MLRSCTDSLAAAEQAVDELWALVRKKIGMRYVMSVVPLDPSVVRGTHGRLPADARDAPVFLCSDASVARDRIAAVDVRDVLLELGGVRAPVAS